MRVGWLLCAVVGSGVSALLIADARADVIVSNNFTPTFVFSGFRTDVGYQSPPGQGNPIFENMAPSQRFIPSQSGPLSSVTTFMDHWTVSGRVTPDVRVSIRADDAGRPGAVLGETSFPVSLFPDQYFPPNPPVTLDLSPLNLSLEAGRPYHVVFRTDTSVVSSAYYSLHMMLPHTNSFGTPAYESRTGGATWPVEPSPFALEIPIQVRVVPEPAAAGVLALAGCAVFTGQRTRDR